MTALITGVVAAAPAAQAAGAIDPSQFVLTRVSTSSAVSKLDALLPNATVEQVLADSPSAAVPMSSPPTPITGFSTGFRWAGTDNTTRDWYPQGVTTSSDAYTDGLYAGRKLMIVAWHAEDGNDANLDQNVRISLVDRTDAAHPVYRHILLVVPYMSGTTPNFRRVVGVHAGGISWYGDYLYVTSSASTAPDGGGGLRVFDLRHIWHLSTAKTTVGLDADGSYYAGSYEYAVPQVLAYTAPSSQAGMFDSIGFDRSTSPDSIVVSETRSFDTTAGAHVVRWPIDYTNRELVSRAGKATATQARLSTVRYLQGAVSYNGTWYLTAATIANADHYGSDMYSWRPDEYTHRYTNTLIHGTNDLSYDPLTDLIWTEAETPTNGTDRFVYSVRRTAFP
ncbi:MAG TPA: hypothetical protein VFL94_08525 [Actinomycetales bacterium]|nr:hypothetical protein [Actinomycetales bacterium]